MSAIEYLRQPVEAGARESNGELEKLLQRPANVGIGFGDLHSFELTQRVAKMWATSSLVPKDFQGNLANCAIALNLARRLGADELMVMQNLYVVHGRPGWSSQFLIATFNTCGRYSSLEYEFVGEPGTDDYGCRAIATRNKTGQRLTGETITIGLAKAEGWYGKQGSKWKSMPGQMLRYRAASWFIRSYAPELSMGLHTADELADMDADPPGGPAEPSGRAGAIDALRQVRPPGGPAKSQQPAPDAWPEQRAEQWFDSSGEQFDHDRHAWSSENNRPAVQADGTFRARRGTARQPDDSPVQADAQPAAPDCAEQHRDLLADLRSIRDEHGIKPAMQALADAEGVSDDDRALLADLLKAQEPQP